MTGIDPCLVPAFADRTAHAQGRIESANAYLVRPAETVCQRSLFMIDWTTDPDMRRRAQSGLDKGESHHALKRAINFHPRGELRDRTEEGQHYRIAGLNLLAAIIIYWNTLKLGEAVLARNKAGLEIPVEFLTHVSPLGWEHINLTGEYRWPGTDHPRSRRKRLA